MLYLQQMSVAQRMTTSFYVFTSVCIKWICYTAKLTGPKIHDQPYMMLLKGTVFVVESLNKIK